MPMQPEWQLLTRALSMREFEDLPFVRSLFFRYGLSFVDAGLRSVIRADASGAATVALNMTPDALGTLIFHYNLRNYDTDETEMNGECLCVCVCVCVLINTKYSPYRCESKTIRNAIGRWSLGRVSCTHTSTG
jgi:hypothetical protein